MDSSLKEDIAAEFRKEYIAAEKKNERPFWKAFHGVNRFIERALNKIYLDIPIAAPVSTALLFTVSPPLAVAALCFWCADAGLAIYSNIACRTRAEGKIWKDIDSGVLPERYNAVLDDRMKSVQAQLELYAAQKAQLPRKGAAAEAFAAATAKEAPAPVAIPAAAPAAPKP